MQIVDVRGQPVIHSFCRIYVRNLVIVFPFIQVQSIIASQDSGDIDVVRNNTGNAYTYTISGLKKFVDAINSMSMISFELHSELTVEFCFY